MTDATPTLTRIRELAEQGRKESQYREKHWNDAGGLHRDTRERFEAILHNLNQMEATMDTDMTDDAQLDYEAPREHNADFANVTRWQLQYICRCGQGSSISTEARYIRQTCRTCGTVWEIAPTLTDSTPHTVKETEVEKDDAQWWNVSYDDGAWEVWGDPGHHPYHESICHNGEWRHAATVHCPRAEAEQAAVDAWREAGFVHAPQEPPKPKQVEYTCWAVIPNHAALDKWCYEPMYDSEDAAKLARQRRSVPGEHRIVKVEAVVSECEGE